MQQAQFRQDFFDRQNEQANLYLNGAKNMADAMHQNTNNAQSTSSRMSIAMRMKQNRDAILGNTATHQDVIFSSAPFMGQQ